MNGSDRSIEHQRKTVLVVEDDGLFRDLLTEVLSENDYSVMVAAGADTALGLLDAHQGPLDLLISDLVLPGISGTELAHTLRRRYPELDVLLISGYSGKILEERGCSVEGYTFLQKPFHPRDFLDLVQKKLG